MARETDEGGFFDGKNSASVYANSYLFALGTAIVLLLHCIPNVWMGHWLWILLVRINSAHYYLMDIFNLLTCTTTLLM